MNAVYIDNQATIFILLCVLIGVALILLILTIINMVAIGALKKKYNSFMIGGRGGLNIEELLIAVLNETRGFADGQIKLERRTRSLEQQIAGCFQKSGVVRYNPFADTGGDLSYVIALLDETDSGFVLNGIFNREGSYTYAKEIENGQSPKYKLSGEEEQAVKLALQKNKQLS